jgi:hypothetical protein
VFSHGSAALLHGLPTYGLDLSRTRVTRSASRSGRIVAGVSHHEATLHERDIDVVDGLVCTGLVRTPLDVTREHGFEAGVVAADAALRAGADTDRMTALADVIRRWPGSRDVQPVVRFADAGSESAGESLSRIFVVSLGFPAPETQFVVRSGSFIARCDMKLRHTPLLIEFDGRIKYRRTRDACDPVIDDGDIVWAEKQREDELRALDYGMFRLIWADLFGSARQRAGQRLLRLAEKHGATPSWPRAS